MTRQLCLAIIVPLLIIGCQAPAPAPATQPMPVAAGPEQIQSIRAAYQKQSPNVEVGVVEDVLMSANLASVDEVNVANFKIGDRVCFVDSTTAPLVCGKIVRITDAQLHVQYETPAAGKPCADEGRSGGGV